MQTIMIEQPVQIPPLGLSGDLVLPERATGMILFAHGSGSSRHSTRNRRVAGVLHHAGFGTLLLDLLTVPKRRWTWTRATFALISNCWRTADGSY
jgi:predicted alpha/beta-hydrolase family hydrolase